MLKWFGGQESDSGVRVNEHTALNTLSVVACVMILADTYASLPLGVFRRMDPRGRERARNHPLYNLLHDEPNPDMTSFTYRHMQMTHMATWGNHYSEIEYDRAGDPLALWPFHPSTVSVERRSDGRLWYRISESSGQRMVPQERMLHIRGLSTNGIVGLSPLSMMRQAIGVSVAAESYAARFFANDARPSVLLKHPGPSLSDTARQNITESWEEIYRGHQNAHKTAILEEGMDVATLSMPLQDAQFLETRRFEVQEFARFFRIPPHLLADVERSTSWGSGIEQQNIGFVVYTMRPWIERSEQEFNRTLLHDDDRDRYFTKFIIDGLMRGDADSRANYYNRMWNMGAMSPNDMLELEDRNPIEGGDEYYVPLNMIPVGTSREPTAGTERSISTPEWRERLQPVAYRSATARRRLANAHQAVFRNSLARLLRYERAEIRKAINNHLRSESTFEQWVKDFYYGEYPDRIRRDMWAPVRTLMEAVAGEAVDEVNADAPDDTQLDQFVTDYVDVLAKRHAGFSRSRLLNIIHDHSLRSIEDSFEMRQDDDLIDDLEDDLEDWEDRADNEAHDETHRGSNAAAKFAYGLAGVAVLRWIAAGDDPCDFCQNMNGRTVGTDDSFLSADSVLDIGGNTFSSQSDIGHPPLHNGCECVISPG